MNRPGLTKPVFPQSRETMTKPHAQAGVIVETNASWRTECPVLDKEACINCLMCYLICPEGAIYKADGTLEIDLDFCKGCGICANECPKKAITMIEEAK